MLQKIIVPVDGLPASLRALDLAIALARSHGSELILGNAVNYAAAIAQVAVPYGVSDATPLLNEVSDAAHSILADAETACKTAGVAATTIVLEGPAVGAIVDAAKAQGAEAIVMGTRGIGGLERWFVGSTADGVLRTADVPVFVVHPVDDAPPPSFKRILVAVDDSDASAAAVAFAIDLAAAESGVPVFAHVIETAGLVEKSHEYGYDATPMLAELRAAAHQQLDAAVAAARARGLVPETLIAEGHAAPMILAAAAAHEAGAIAIGTHGRRGLRRLFVGSVAEAVVRESPVPVVVVRR